jgi:hypothetical protein
MIWFGAGGLVFLPGMILCDRQRVLVSGRWWSMAVLAESEPRLSTAEFFVKPRPTC